MSKDFSPRTRRVVGPIPPRDKNHRLMIPPLLGKRAKRDELDIPLRDEDGHVIFEQGDTRDPSEYMGYEQGQKPLESATKGLSLFRVDLDPEPICLVYARHEEDAIRVYRAEMGITRFGERDPIVTREG